MTIKVCVFMCVCKRMCMCMRMSGWYDDVQCVPRATINFHHRRDNSKSLSCVELANDGKSTCIYSLFLACVRMDVHVRSLIRQAAIVAPAGLYSTLSVSRTEMMHLESTMGNLWVVARMPSAAFLD